MSLFIEVLKNVGYFGVQVGPTIYVGSQGVFGVWDLGLRISRFSSTKLCVASYMCFRGSSFGLQSKAEQNTAQPPNPAEDKPIPH